MLSSGSTAAAVVPWRNMSISARVPSSSVWGVATCTSMGAAKSTTVASES